MDLGCAKCGDPHTVYLGFPEEQLAGQREPQAIRYCKRCFLDSMEGRFQRVVEQHIREGDRLLVGLSGGKDSQLLLHLLMSSREKARFDIIAITVDEGIAGYRNIGIELAHELTQKYGIEHKILSFRETIGCDLDEIRARYQTEFDLGKFRVCRICTSFRHRLMRQYAMRSGLTKLVYGVNLTDLVTQAMEALQSEKPREVLLGLGVRTRGAYDGGELEYLAPLYQFTDKDIALYDVLAGIPYEREPECPYSRDFAIEKLRSCVLQSESSLPGFIYRFWRGIQAIQSSWSMDSAPLRVQRCASCRDVLPYGYTARLCFPCAFAFRYLRKQAGAAKEESGK